MDDNLDMILKKLQTSFDPLPPRELQEIVALGLAEIIETKKELRRLVKEKN